MTRNWFHNDNYQASSYIHLHSHLYDRAFMDENGQITFIPLSREIEKNIYNPIEHISPIAQPTVETFPSMRYSNSIAQQFYTQGHTGIGATTAYNVEQDTIHNEIFGNLNPKQDYFDQEHSQSYYHGLSKLIEKLKPMEGHVEDFSQNHIQGQTVFPVMQESKEIPSSNISSRSPNLSTPLQSIANPRRNAKLIPFEMFKSMSKDKQDEYLMSLIVEQKKPPSTSHNSHKTVWYPSRDIICQALKIGTGRLNRLAQKKYEAYTKGHVPSI